MTIEGECPDCKGTGDQDGTEEDCLKCKGTGVYYRRNIVSFRDDPEKKERRKKAEKDIGKKLNEQEMINSEKG